MIQGHPCPTLELTAIKTIAFDARIHWDKAIFDLKTALIYPFSALLPALPAAFPTECAAAVPRAHLAQRNDGNCIDNEQAKRRKPASKTYRQQHRQHQFTRSAQSSS